MSFGWRTVTVAADAVVVLGLGTNLGDRVAHLRAALAGIATLGSIERTSRVYESEPYGFLDQPRFLNMAVLLHTVLAPDRLLLMLKELEVRIGRTPSHRMGPRVIDIDVLFYGETRIDHPGLTIPHPGIMERPFVLAPLLDLDPDMRHPLTGERLADRLRHLPHESLVPIGSAETVLGRAGESFS